jgi:hypothetical protein
MKRKGDEVKARIRLKELLNLVLVMWNERYPQDTFRLERVSHFQDDYTDPDYGW